MENIELSECIYEHIKDTFYFGFKNTGYFNATKLCIEGGKDCTVYFLIKGANKRQIN